MTKKTIQLSVEKRNVTGKKVKQLRKQGILPANVYGKSVKSLAVQSSVKDFDSAYKQVGETSLLELSVKGEKSPRHVLIHNLVKHPVSGEYIHADLHEVSLKDKMTVDVPIAIVGKSSASEKNIGVFLQITNDLEVEGLPADLPEEIEVDISSLNEIGDEITVSNVKASGNFTIKTNPETVIARINPLEKEVEPEPVPAEAEGTEGETPAEGLTPAEGEKKEDQKTPEKPVEKKPQE